MLFSKPRKLTLVYIIAFNVQGLNHLFVRRVDLPQLSSPIDEVDIVGYGRMFGGKFPDTELFLKLSFAAHMILVSEV